METQNKTIWFSVIESVVWFVLDEPNRDNLTKLINNSYELLRENDMFLDIDTCTLGYSIVVLGFFSIDLESKEHYQAIHNIMKCINGWNFSSNNSLSTVYPLEYWITANILRPDEDDEETRKCNIEMLRKKLTYSTQNG